MNNRVREILTDLERVRENLLALSDDIWLSIDHNNAEELEDGIEFKRAYNQCMNQFDLIATEISERLQTFTGVRVENDEQEPVSAQNGNRADRDRIIQKLDETEPHQINEDFSYTRPYGFKLDGQAYADIVTWRRLYELICQELATQDLARFKNLPNNPDFMSKFGNRAFTTDPDALRVASDVGHGVFAEVHYSANSIIANIRRLLDEFGIPHSELFIYLREDRDAEVT